MTGRALACLWHWECAPRGQLVLWNFVASKRFLFESILPRRKGWQGFHWHSFDKFFPLPTAGPAPLIAPASRLDLKVKKGKPWLSSHPSLRRTPIYSIWRFSNAQKKNKTSLFQINLRKKYKLSRVEKLPVWNDIILEFLIILFRKLFLWNFFFVPRPLPLCLA